MTVHGPARTAVEIQVSEVGTGNVVVDGADVSSAVRAFSVDAKAGHLTRVQLDLCAATTSLRGEANVRLSDATRTALLALGWTPPVGDEVVRFWVYTHQDMLDEMRSDEACLPEGWTILRALRVPDVTSAINRYLVEIADPNAAAEADGKVIEPALYRKDGARAVVKGYGIPAAIA